jgi:hypothetical protein
MVPGKSTSDLMQSGSLLSEVALHVQKLMKIADVQHCLLRGDDLDDALTSKQQQVQQQFAGNKQGRSFLHQ